MRNQKLFTGMRGFVVVWLGQVVSLLGSGMTGFAIGLWAWEETGQATALALTFFFFIGPSVIMSPFAGAIVDRYDRKTIMILSDVAAGVSTMIILILYLTDSLQIWHIFVTNAFSGAFQAFQFPAYSAAVSTMLPKEQYARANGMMALAGSAGNILAPIAAGMLWGLTGLKGIIIIDIVTFLVAVAALLLVVIPAPKVTAEGQAGSGNLMREAAYGFRYIFARPSLLGLQLVFFTINFTAMIGVAVMVPMILARTGNNELILASIQSLGAIGGVAGGLLLSTWGGPKRRIHGVLIGMILISLLGAIPLGISRTLLLWATGAFFTQFFLPILNGSNQAIWQAKVAPDVQGRVFSVRRLIAQATAPMALLMAGPLADLVFEPALQPDGNLAGTFGWLVGTGPGAGMGLMFVISGLLSALIGLSGYAFRAVRDVENILPDHDALMPATAVASD